MTNQFANNSSNYCSQCGKRYLFDEMIEFDKLRVCYKCKPIVLQKLREGIMIETKKSAIKRSIWWKIYFFVSVALMSLGVVGMLTDEAAGIAEALVILFAVIGTIGLYGYVFSKRVYFRTFWLYFFPVYIAINILYYFITNIDLSAGMTPQLHWATSISSWIFALPGFIGILLYALPSNRLWDNDE